MVDSKEITAPLEKELRSYGLMMGGVLSLFTAIFAYRNFYAFAGVLGILALIFFVLGLLMPNALTGVHQRWMKFAAVLGAFNLKIILGFVYLTAFTLVRLVFLITRKDPMRRKFNKEATTYWTDHLEPDSDPKRYERLY